MNMMTQLFYKLMYRRKTIKRKCASGRTYIIEYHRSPFWTYEKRTLGLFFKEKVNTWRGQVWEVFKNGGSCGFGTICVMGKIFPRRDMKAFLMHETNYLERIFGESDEV